MMSVTAAGDFVLPDLEEIRAESLAVDVARTLDSSTDEELPWSRPAVALAMLESPDVPIEVLAARAEERCAARLPQLKTFVPLYTTNHCDSECKMCSMRKGNDRMERKFATRSELIEQLDVLYSVEGVRGVGLLTGEYDSAYTRLATAFRIGWLARQALDMGFQDVYINIGSLTPPEIEVFADWIEDRQDAITLCVFQESYDRQTFRRFMGDTPETIPKADFDRRITSFDRWLEAGFSRVNPGALIGLQDNIADELVNLVAHAAHLRGKGATVDLSLPRMRPASTSRASVRVGDDAYVRMTAALAFTCWDHRLVLTNREPLDVRNRVIGMSGIISPGSPDVAPYSRNRKIVNEELSSQFLVADLRTPGEILAQIEDSGRPVTNFADPRRASV